MSSPISTAGTHEPEDWPFPARDTKRSRREFKVYAEAGQQPVVLSGCGTGPTALEALQSAVAAIQLDTDSDSEKHLQVQQAVEIRKSSGSRSSYLSWDSGIGMEAEEDVSWTNSISSTISAGSARAVRIGQVTRHKVTVQDGGNRRASQPAIRIVTSPCFSEEGSPGRSPLGFHPVSVAVPRIVEQQQENEASSSDESTESEDAFEPEPSESHDAALCDQSSASSSHTTSSSSTPGQTAESFSSNTSSKRKARLSNNSNHPNNDPNDDNSDHPKPSTINPAAKRPRLEPTFRLSCPYRKRNPLRFNIRTHRLCAITCFTDVAELRRHIQEFHRRPFIGAHKCLRCYAHFANENGLRTHQLYLDGLCELAEDEDRRTGPDPEDGIDDATARKLRCKKGRVSDPVPVQWSKIWELLFPGTEVQGYEYCAVIEHVEGFEDLSSTIPVLISALYTHGCVEMDRADSAEEVVRTWLGEQLQNLNQLGMQKEYRTGLLKAYAQLSSPAEASPPTSLSHSTSLRNRGCLVNRRKEAVTKSIDSGVGLDEIIEEAYAEDDIVHRVSMQTSQSRPSKLTLRNNTASMPSHVSPHCSRSTLNSLRFSHGRDSVVDPALEIFTPPVSRHPSAMSALTSYSSVSTGSGPRPPESTVSTDAAIYRPDTTSFTSSPKAAATEQFLSVAGPTLGSTFSCEGMTLAAAEEWLTTPPETVGVQPELDREWMMAGGNFF